MSITQEFKEFISRGNVIELAVASNNFNKKQSK